MKRLFQSIVLVFVLFSCFITPIHADTGPKPSVTITFKGTNEEYYVTLLSSIDGYGPWSKVDEFNLDDSVNQSIWEAFNNYEDEYYFIGYFEECTNTHKFSWTYYAPDKFKILIYYPNSNTFIESEIIEKYAYDSYYNVTFNDNAFEIELQVNYNYTKEILSFIARIGLTIAIELIFTCIFALTSKQHIKVIVFTNIFTQILLNIGLHFYGNGCYIMIEGLIIIIEALSYKHFMKDIKTSVAWGYSILSNIISFILGLMLSFTLPIF